EPGYMGKHCPAACRICPMVDIANRCPIDPESNVFKPGDMNVMFERLLEEAGQDPSTYSRENLPVGGKHPSFGEMKVITSPYHDVMPYLSEADHEDFGFQPLPWVVTIDGFLSDEECDLLAKHGDTQGYERSETFSAQTIDGSTEYFESEGRTSTNTWCKEGCEDDPVVERVIERIAKLTGIPYDNYEHFQLVRYLPGQFYKEHHDADDSQKKLQQGMRILTVFLYLNDVESGGGTKFNGLNYTVIPKKGKAVVWPSVDDNIENMQEWTYHEALPVEKGIKYGANTWIYLREYGDAPEWCQA
ncbi:hypothetical protein ACHAWF_002025, partial [Thalassiosira exigua]